MNSCLSPIFTRVLTLLSPAILVACAGSDSPNKPPELVNEGSAWGETLVYECTGTEFLARMGEGEVALWLEDRQLVLPHVPSGSGAKYVKDDVTFWTKGEEAILTIGKQQFSGCELAPHRVPWEDARRRGVDFRAVGNEPGWFVEIRHDSHILYVGDYGQTRVLFSEPRMETQGGKNLYFASNSGKELRVEVVDELCTDTMKGETFSSQVTVSYAGNTYRGCGNSLVSHWE